MIRKGTEQIESLDVWKKLAGPKRDYQWKDGRSAKESARAWLDSSPHLPVEIAQLLALNVDFGQATSWTAEPEARVRFDSFGGEPANLDSLVDATDLHSDFVIAVEAKADESFGADISTALRRAQSARLKNPRSKAGARLE